MDTSNMKAVADLLGFDSERISSMMPADDDFMSDPTNDCWSESYQGDGSPIPHGGVYLIDSDAWSRSYQCAIAVRVDQACDAPYQIFIERITVNRPDTLAGIIEACETCGLSPDELLAMKHDDRHLAEIFACAAYGHYDPDRSNPYEPSSAAIMVADWQDEWGEFVEYVESFNDDPADIISRDRAYDILKGWIADARTHNCMLCTEAQAHAHLYDML